MAATHLGVNAAMTSSNVASHRREIKIGVTSRPDLGRPTASLRVLEGGR